MSQPFDVRDQAYQFFLEEAPELLQMIESGLLALRQERETAQVHEIMRAAHSLKGGAASVGLEAIKVIAHRLEALFKALYSDSLVLDRDLESDLLRAFDCLRLPLNAQLSQGYFDPDAALATAEPILADLESRFQDAIAETANYIPSSTDLGVNMALSIFDIDVGQGLDHLKAVLDHPERYAVAGELRAQAEVFIGFAELLNLPGFAQIAQTAIQALALNPAWALEITALAWEDFCAGRAEVLAGQPTGGGAPGAGLMALAGQVESLAAGSAPSLAFELDLPARFAPQALDLPDLTMAPPANAQPVPDFGFDLAAPGLGIDLAPVAATDAATDVPALEAAGIEAIFADMGGRFQVAATAQPATGEPLSDGAAAPASTGSLPSKPRPQRRAVSSTVRVDTERLVRMDNTLGELTINRNGVALQTDQIRLTLRELFSRCEQLRTTVEQLRSIADQLLLAPERQGARGGKGLASPLPALLQAWPQPSFDSLEMDSYSLLYTQTQTLLEDLLQLEEGIGDLTLFNRQAEQHLGQHRKMLSQLQEEMRWAKMMPLGEVFNRFPRVLRDLANTYQKPAELVLAGTDLLMDRAVLEKLHAPLLHLLRNGFDHGLETPDVRRQRGKPETGQITLQASYQGRRVIIEVSDDGQGLDLERIGRRAVDLGWLTAAALSPDQLCELIFRPGFSTAATVSDLSGRGMGLDVVREQLERLQGTVAVSSTPGQGTTFTLSLPLTLSVVNLLVCFAGVRPIALRSDNITEVFIPRSEQLSSADGQLMLRWQEQAVPVYRLEALLPYHCLVPKMPLSRVLTAVPAPTDWESPLLILHRGEQVLALQVERLVTEQESIIKPFGSALQPPDYTYGCTVLGDGSLIPVIDGGALLATLAKRPVEVPEPRGVAGVEGLAANGLNPPSLPQNQSKTVLVVDDALTSRRMLALSLERAGYRVLQARDGQDALDQLQQSAVQLVVCDIEMPNVNGFEFLTQRRQNPLLASIPTVMLTSRSNDKHRWLAMQLGANAYFTKPYLEQEFLSAIATHLAARD